MLLCSFFLSQLKNYSHDSGKAVRRVPKRKQAARDTETHRRSVLNVRLFLREFCVDFLENCYNGLLYLVKVATIPSKNNFLVFLYRSRFKDELIKHYKT